MSVTTLATNEVYSALDKGVIDFADRGDLTANLEAGLAEVAKYIIMPGPHQPTTATSYVANRAAYEKLSAPHKAALASAAREISGALRQHILVADTLALKAFQGKGVEVTTLSADELAQGRVQATKAGESATKGNPLAKKMMDSQIAFMKDLGLLS
ncbi:type 2 periplasmic-binding domain-containing protein [Advenella kashmirensis]|uniref:hypothetical protein n=1 Tax=Advenella kashmirensis TaxID=310575 RepID=UPI001EE64F3A|nr:hypothetical protein [Advenella kashmirensis]